MSRNPHRDAELRSRPRQGHPGCVSRDEHCPGSPLSVLLEEEIVDEQRCRVQHDHLGHHDCGADRLDELRWTLQCGADQLIEQRTQHLKAKRATGAGDTTSRSGADARRAAHGPTRPPCAKAPTCERGPNRATALIDLHKVSGSNGPGANGRSAASAYAETSSVSNGHLTVVSKAMRSCAALVDGPWPSRAVDYARRTPSAVTGLDEANHCPQ